MLSLPSLWADRERVHLHRIMDQGYKNQRAHTARTAGGAFLRKERIDLQRLKSPFFCTVSEVIY